jgi:S1-C subfamily serine protease
MLVKNDSNKEIINNIENCDLEILADNDRIEQVFVNLIENAIKYSKEGTPITLDYEVEADKLAINVKNDTTSSSGSGVIVDADVFDEDGAKINSQNEFYILTCYHVVSGGGNITVYLPDENARNFNDPEYDSKYTFTGVIDNKIHNDKAITLVGGDSFTDIAVLKLDVTGSGVSSDKIVEAHLPASDYTHSYGEEVFAIGNPGGTMPMSVSQGIISYLERTMSFDGTELTVMQNDATVYREEFNEAFDAVICDVPCSGLGVIYSKPDTSKLFSQLLCPFSRASYPFRYM